MLIEFIGLPGSGKSTLITHAEKRLRKTGRRIHNIGKLSRKTAAAQAQDIQYLNRYEGRSWLYGCFAFAQKNPRVFDVLFQHTRGDFHQNIWAMDFLAQLHFLEKANTGDDIVFLDEGFMQRGAAAFMGKKPGDALNRYLDAVPVADVLVSVNVGPRLAFSRARSRKGGVPDSFIGNNKLETLQNLSAYSQLLSYIKQKQRDRGGVVIDLDGANDLPDNVETLTNALELRQIGTPVDS